MEKSTHEIINFSDINTANTWLKSNKVWIHTFSVSDGGIHILYKK